MQPDLQALIRLSALYNTSTDMILGLTQDQRYERVQQIEERARRLDDGYRHNAEAAWTLLRDQILAHPEDYSLYLRLMQMTWYRKLSTPERVEHLIMLVCWMENACHNREQLWGAYRLIIQICHACPDQRYREKALEYYGKIPPLQESREPFARYVLQGDALKTVTQQTLYRAMSIAETAFRDLMPENLSVEQRVDWRQRSLQMYRAMLGEGYAGVYEVPLLESYAALTGAYLEAGDREAADKTLETLLSLLRRQIDYHRAPGSVKCNDIFDHLHDPKYLSVQHCSLDLLLRMLCDAVFEPYLVQLKDFSDEYRAAFNM
ncbi:MAG: hypothetical protein IJW40_07315 [Clostridia bacterium]|nr:hypothetical protein [Clostridia bacterium]